MDFHIIAFTSPDSSNEMGFPLLEQNSCKEITGPIENEVIFAWHGI